MKRTLALIACVTAWAGTVCVGQPSSGDMAPELVLSYWAQSGHKWAKPIEENRGKVIVLVFWATWCRPCVAEFPSLNALAERLKYEDVVFIAVTSEEPENVDRFLETHEMKMHVAVDEFGATWRRYGVTGLPMKVVIQADGRVSRIGMSAQFDERSLRGLVEGRGERGASKVWGWNVASPGHQAWVSLTDENRERDQSWVQADVSATDDSMGAVGLPLVDAVCAAAGVDASRVEGKELLPSGNWNVRGYMRDARPGAVHDVMLSTIGARFGLEFSRETREMEVLVARVADGGVRLQEAEGNEFRFSRSWPTLHGSACDVGELLEQLSRAWGVPVVDETGVEGKWKWDVKLEGVGAGNRAAFAERELGLTLTPEKREVEVVVVRKRG